ncbi:TIGR03986 family CRISPR-associated RAMP protein [Lujinxingia litoralis]|uniref:TIGR03986 family CRISPR-associated RAMP protein n=1 Tax=Lujinxingia litoralis TaxID=2211119 RepID=A0A328C4A1_9DELT|nr:TIGR03986 family CRISPR-associated RAMP protein [Lujinxingia litoralis]RAL20665.1 TIGR03986 family CRISPR-associated RAMP protein [Lujinxingia litoralis]
MAADKGILRLSKKGAVQIEFVSKKGKTVLANAAQDQLSHTLRTRLNELDGQEVEFERVGGQPKRIREVGGAFVTAYASGDSNGGGRGKPRRSTRSQRHSGSDSQKRNIKTRHFHNPYNFVPAPPRDTLDPELGDHPPVSQDSFEPALYTGRIGIRLVAKTPLLVPDIENAQESPNGHKTFPLLLSTDGKPSIPASGIRGMLRSAYEAITNSRFGTFSNELRSRLAFRMNASDGLRLIPARVESGEIRLMTGVSKIARDGQLDQGDPQYAAWLGRYRNGQLDSRAMRYPDGSLPAHGDAVECWLERFQHHRWNRRRKRHTKDFQYVKVRAIIRQGEQLGAMPEPSQGAQVRGRSWHEPLGSPLIRVKGWVCITNANINRKHDERVFFSSDTSHTPNTFSLKNSHRDLWRELIQNYQSIHQDDLRRRRQNGQAFDEYLGREPGKTGWSRHIYTSSDVDLKDGTLCYVRLNDQQTDVEAIFPVMIARELYPVSPWELLPASLRPATSLDELSPADRVFGWVRAKRGAQGAGAVRGLLRVGPVTCMSAVEDAVETFPHPGVPLAILSAPKPQQGRFYVARDSSGEAQKDSLAKNKSGYSRGKGLRGRKVYPHQRSLSQAHWQEPLEDRTQTGIGSPAHYQEYRRPQRGGEEQRDDQNRSILGWVKPGAEFRFDIHVHNLSRVELGALVWLLSLPSEYFLRFGGGKPFGFGSVRLEVDTFDVRSGDNLRNHYSSWMVDSVGTNVHQVSKEAFQRAILQIYSTDGQTNVDEVSFIKAFLTACRGHKDNLPTHYPRATVEGLPGPPNPAGESFKWFVANERQEACYALENLASDEGMPVLKEK